MDVNEKLEINKKIFLSLIKGSDIEKQIKITIEHDIEEDNKNKQK
jgi:hypothetical protein